MNLEIVEPSGKDCAEGGHDPCEQSSNLAASIIVSGRQAKVSVSISISPLEAVS
ncbi:MAG: hypothetical protein HXS46_15720 [Theionarchaea archaeon]|nr:hypothetical protein [Theionarchaea archaeon]